MQDQNGEWHDLKNYRGGWLAVYFYPKDDTPGCTKEAIGFSEHLGAFKAAGAQVFGVSRDTMAKHDKFAAKHDLTVPLLSDAEGTVTEAYGVWVEKSMYGKTFMGTERTTFVIDTEGKIEAVMPKVRPKEHLDKLLEVLG